MRMREQPSSEKHPWTRSTASGRCLGPGGYGDATGQLARAYPVRDAGDIRVSVERLIGDMGFGAPARRFARLIAATGARAYLYDFTRVGEG